MVEPKAEAMPDKQEAAAENNATTATATDNKAQDSIASRRPKRSASVTTPTIEESSSAALVANATKVETTTATTDDDPSNKKLAAQDAAAAEDVEMADVERASNNDEVKKKKKPAANNKLKKRKRSGSSSKAPPSKKQRKAKKAKRRRRTEEEKKKYLEDGIADAKKDFEELRDKTLAEIPEKYKSMFGQIGFTKYGKVFWPVLVLSPFSISPGGVRDQWFDMFEKVKEKRRIDNMSYLAYYYGSDLNDNCYSFIPKNTFTTYENGVKKGYDKLPKNIQKKVDGKGKLTKADSEVIQRLEEMREDLKKEPKERRGKLDDVREGYEMLSMSDLDDFTDASEEEEEERLESEDEMLVDEEFSETEVKQKKKGRRSSKTAKKKAAAKKDESVRKTEESVREDGLPDVPVTDVGEIEDIGDIEASEEDEKDEDFMEEGEPIDEEEHDDDWRAESKKKPKGAARKKKKVSERSDKKEKPVKQKQKKERKRSKPSDEDELDRCEKLYLPRIRDWEQAVESEDLQALEACFDDVWGVVEDYSAVFMEKYLADLSKKTRSLLKTHPEGQRLLPKQRNLREKMKEVHEKKKRSAPKRPVPKIKQPPKSPTKTKESREGKADLGSQKASEQAVMKKKAPDIAKQPSSPVPLAKGVPRKQSSEGLKKEARGSIPVRGTSSPVRSSAAPPKPERRAFTLGSLMHREPKNQQFPASKQAKLPAWLTGPPGDQVPEQQDRSLALEFLKEMASHFPAGKVNKDSVARSFEKAIYEWAAGKGQSESKGGGGPDTKAPWVDKYWERVHAVVAAICGKHGSGTLMQQIMNGDYSEPSQVVMLEYDTLCKSFEGLPFL